MKKIIIIISLITVSISHSQNLDSLYNRYLEIRGIKTQGNKVASATEIDEKCSFGIKSEIKINYEKFSAKQKMVLSSLLSRPAKDTSIVSPSGRFKIHYDVNKYDSPTYNVNEVAKIADYVYSYEVNSLKYPPPANDGDGIYDIYIESLGDRTYGETSWDSVTVDNKAAACYTSINYDYSSLPTQGLNAVKVTLAHEFHHAIQTSNYIFRSADTYYYEITSTAMEDIVYDSVNDYYHYLANEKISNCYFLHADIAFARHAGYDLAIWNLFMRDRFGVDIIKEIWEEMPSKRAVECINDILIKHNSTLQKEFNEFGKWTFFTNSRAISGQYFKEASNYPLIKMGMQTAFVSPTISVKVTSEAITNNFVEVIDGGNSIVSLVTNADIQSSVNESGTIQFELSLSNNSSSGYGSVYGNYFSKVTSDNPKLITDSYFYNGKLVDRIMNIDYAYPQPFVYSKNSILYLPAELTSNGLAEINIFTIDMNLVYSSQTKISSGEKVVVPWNALDNSGKKLGSGIYIYVIKCGDNLRKGKIAILND